MTDTIPDLEPENTTSATDAAACAEALRVFFAADFKPGAFISKDWLHQTLGVPHPRTANSYDGMQDLTFRFLSRYDTFQRALLVNSNIALQNVRGQGYRIVLPNEQSTWAVSEALRELRRAMSKGFTRARHVNVDALTNEERRMRDDDLSRLRNLKRLISEREDARQRRERYAELTANMDLSCSKVITDDEE